MDFKEFIEQEEAELFDEGIGAPLRFAAGAAGNFISQTARGVGNLGYGAAQGTLGMGQTALGALQALGGGEEKAAKTLAKGIANVGKGAGRIARGAVQGAGALSGVTPLLRGAQAATQPRSKERKSFIQDLSGLDSWQTTPSDPGTPSVPEAPRPRQEQKPVAVKRTQKDPAGDFLRRLGEREKRKEQPEEWKQLVAAYKTAKTSQERKQLRARMRSVSPALYQQAVEAGRSKLAGRQSV